MMSQEQLQAELRKMNPALLASKVEYLTTITDRAAELYQEQFGLPASKDFLVGCLFGTIACLEVTGQRGGLGDLVEKDQ